MLNFLRSEQRSVVDRIYRLLDRYDIVLLCAPTGFGKTLIALSLAYLLDEDGNRCVIYVRTRNQLSRYVEDCVNFFNNVPRVLLNRYLTCIGHPPCDRCGMARSLSRDIIIRLRIFDPYSESSMRLFKSLEVCPYHAYRSINSFVTVCTYPYLYSPSLRKVLDDYNIAIIDEAHNLDNMTSIGIEHSRMIKLVSTFLRIGRELKSPDVIDMVRRLAQRIDALLRIEFARLKREAIGEVLSIVDTLFYTCSSYMTLEEREIYVELRSAIEHALNMDLDIVQNSDGVLMFRTTRTEIVGKLLNSFEKAVLMSGTLPSRWYIEKVWGLDMDSTFMIRLSSDNNNIEINCVPELTTKYSDRTARMYVKYVEKICEIYERSEKSITVYFPSREVMREIVNRMINRVGKDRIVMSDRAIGDICEIVKRGKYIIVDVCGGKLSEGIEFVDRERRTLTISDIVIVGVPYPKYDTYMKMLLEELEKRGVDPKMYMIEKAWMMIRQAVGRGMRMGYRGRVRIWLLDSRYLQPTWIEKIRELKNVELIRK